MRYRPVATEFTAERLAVVSRLFSHGVLHELARLGRSSRFARLARASYLLDADLVREPVAALYQRAFHVLAIEGCRDEYVYRSALTHNVLLGRHSLQAAAMLNEFRVGECKADVVILNGTSTVYEIKSERDSLARLERQVTAYGSVFGRIYVIAAEKHLPEVMASVPAQVGVMRLNRDFQIVPEREATDRACATSPLAIFDAIRTDDEARKILKAHGVTIPAVPNTKLHAALREQFVRLSPRQAHDGMVQVLRNSRNLRSLSDLVARLPRSLQPAVLAVTLRKSDHERLVRAVNTRLQDALAWG